MLDISSSPQIPGGSYLWEKSYPPGLRWNSKIKVQSLGALLDATVAAFGERPAFDFMGKKWLWRDMGAEVTELAAALQTIGVEKGARVGLLLPNSPTFVIAYYALMKIGAVVVNFNPLYTAKEIQNQINDAGVSVMITLDLVLLYDKIKNFTDGSTSLKKIVVGSFAKLLPFPKNILFPIVKRAEVARIKTDDPHHVKLEDILVKGATPRPVTIDPERDIALFQYTGGTTGTPKGAMLTHANLTANAEQAALWFQDAKLGQEKMLGVIPFFHVFAMTAVMNLGVRLGFEIVALPRFDLNQTLKLIHTKKPHFFPAVPAIYNAINNHKDLKKYDLRSLRYCVSGGAPLPVEVKKTFERLTGCTLVEGYGLTESSPIACVNPIVGHNKAGSIGLPLPGTIVEIVDKDDKKTLLPLGERGELCLRGPQIMVGYYNRVEETAQTLRDGRLYTGDIAYMDEDGYVYIVDRIKDLIITNGYNVYPRNVEEAIYQHPDVQECIVAGIPDVERGEIVKAWIKPREGRDLTAEQLRTWLKESLSPMEMPRQFEIRQTPLPKTLIGKLSRKDILAEERAKSEA